LEYQKIERAALDFYIGFKSSHGSKLSSHFLKISQKLTPMRVACSGGKYPLDDTEDVDNGDDDEAETKKQKKKVVKYSDFVFKSKFEKLLVELKRNRDEDHTCK
jgi:hypothetical protein